MLHQKLSLEGDIQNKQYSFFLFVNSGSGSNAGAALLKQQIQRIQFVLPIQPQSQITYRCSLFIYNMRKNRQQGFAKLKKQSQVENKKCYLIVCGGDGTVMWVVTEMVKHQIKISAVPVGIIPLGTGNDFSRELGWGGQAPQLVDSTFKKLKSLMRKWIKAKQQYFDIWDVQAEVFQDGKFEKVQNFRNSMINGMRIKKTFCNYFSFGIDGKIGYSFDMHRTKTRFGNLAMYACLGLIKAMTRTKTLDELLDHIQIVNNDKTSRRSSLREESIKSNITDTMSRSMIIRGSRSETSYVRSIQKQEIFANDYYNILVLNVNSYTGGVKDIWEKSKNGFRKGQSSIEQHDVSTADGKLEIVTFGSSIGIAMQRTVGGFSKKVAQGEGPFIFHFQRYEKRPKHRTYLQVDGEFIRFTHPKLIKISHSTLVPYGKIKVIRNIAQKNQ